MEGNIPFSWENKPGIRKDKIFAGEGRGKVVQDISSTTQGRRKLPLPPLPCENSDKATCVDDDDHHIRIPLPPCAFPPPSRSSSRRSKADDPFLIAYKECTKSNKKGTLMRKNSFLASCKHSCSVRDDSIVRVSHIPTSNADRKRLEGVKY
ncbi:hypothetical protein Ccrd_023045 [Cynara cardunculus var. scolymus]|uniref:Uncharacterized protein n=1 Tax=Cynara cardunculus var. scolymus TaxID=59895 RepID=A0A103XXM3_CYNCS|nr:hypothetical protein Ccrd_023045 [Cynara cardunculus var. scolymus]